MGETCCRPPANIEIQMRYLRDWRIIYWGVDLVGASSVRVCIAIIAKSNHIMNNPAVIASFCVFFYFPLLYFLLAQLPSNIQIFFLLVPFVLRKSQGGPLSFSLNLSILVPGGSASKFKQ